MVLLLSKRMNSKQQEEGRGDDAGKTTEKNNGEGIIARITMDSHYLSGRTGRE